MKERMIRFLVCLYIMSGCLTACQTPKEKLLVAGCGWRQVAILDKESGRIEWSHALGEGEDCNDIEITPDGHILYAYTSGARLISREQQVVWDFKALPGEELFTATRLPSGHYLLAICGTPSRLLTLNEKGTQVDEQVFTNGITQVHDQFRQIAVTDRNTYLIPLMGKGEIIEMNRQGDILNKVYCGGNPFAVQILPDGNWLASCGDDHSFVEINPKNRAIETKVESGNLDRFALLFVAELVRYANGNTLISNWNGHSDDKSQPLLIEIDAARKVVWSLPPNPDIANISAVYSFNE